jgi:hypothetical protein
MSLPTELPTMARGRPGRPKRKYLILKLGRETTSLAAASTPPAREAELEGRAQRAFRKSRRELIAEIAYLKAERRGFRGGTPEQDWFEAEQEVEERLRRTRPF